MAFASSGPFTSGARTPSPSRPESPSLLIAAYSREKNPSSHNQVCTGPMQPPTPMPLKAAAKRNPCMKMMECQMDWISDLLPMYLLGKQREELINCVIHRLTDWMDEIESQIVTPGIPVIIRAMLACFCANLQNFDSALKWINDAMSSLKTMARLSLQHHRALTYLLNTNLFKINRKMKLMQGVRMKLIEEGDRQTLHEISGMYSENDKSFHAMLYFAKATLAKKLMRQDEAIQLLRRTVELEKSCSHWHRALYQALRKQRKDSGIFGKGGSKEERSCMEMAYSLDPQFCLNRAYYASMLEENLKIKKSHPLLLDDVKENMYKEIISLMISSLEKNPEDRWTHVRLAEIYGCRNLDPKEAERIFEELEQRWPDSSMVHHKFGLYYERTKKDSKKAMEHFQRALECDISNYPCMMDFLKVSVKLNRNKKEMLEMVNKSLGPEYMYNTAPLVKLLIIKGILSWLVNDAGGTGRLDACNAWIAAAEKEYQYCILTAELITSGWQCYIGDFAIDVTQVESTFKVLRTNGMMANSEAKQGVVSNLLLELRNKSHGSLTLHRRLSEKSTASSFSSTSSFKTARSNVDLGNNWREPSSALSGNNNSVFSRYQDPMEVRFRERCNQQLVKLPPPSNDVMRKRNAFKNRNDDNNPCQADLDNDWRR